MPPYKLVLDKCWNGEEVGSRAVYDFLLKKQPLYPYTAISTKARRLPIYGRHE